MVRISVFTKKGLGMQLYDILFQAGIDSKTRSDLQTLAEESTTVEDLLAGWPLIETESISFEPVIDDENPEIQLIEVGFKRGRSELAQMYFTKDLPSKEHIKVVPIDHFKVGYSRHGGITWDESAWDTWHTRLGFEDSYAMCSKVGPYSALLPYLLSYILSDGGSVYLSRSEHYTRPDDYEDEIAELKEEGIDADSLLVVHATYYSPTPVDGVVPGSGNSVYFRFDGAIEKSKVHPTIAAPLETARPR